MSISHDWNVTNYKLEDELYTGLDWELISSSESGEFVRSYGSVNLKGEPLTPTRNHSAF